jgi:hypothetical protein
VEGTAGLINPRNKIVREMSQNNSPGNQLTKFNCKNMKNRTGNQTLLKKEFKRMFYIMRNTLILLICTFQLQAVASYGQTARLTLDTKEIHLEQLFKQIEKNSEFLFNYLDADIENIKAKISVKNGTIQEILTQALKNTSLTYSINDRHITIFRMQQNPGKTIHGTVLDSRGEAIPGVNLVEKGTTNGTTTDLDGKFSINVASNKDVVLTFSFVGFIPQEVQVGDKSVLSITLIEDTQALDEVVVVGYGTQRRGNLTGSVSAIKSEQITVAPVGNVTNALTGKLPGLITKQSTGLPGSDQATLNIRGFGSHW